MKPFEIDEYNKEKIRDIIQLFELAKEANRQRDRYAFKIIVDNIKIEKDVIAPLEEIAKWDKNHDEKIINKLSSKIKDETDGKKLENIYEKIQKVFDKNGGLLGRLLSPLKKKETQNNEQLKLKKIIGFIKIISKFNFLIFNEIIAGQNFSLLVIRPLKEMSDWDMENDLMIKELYEGLREKTSSKKTLKEKGDALNTWLKRGKKIAVLIGITGAIGGLAYYYKKKKGPKKTEE